MGLKVKSEICSILSQINEKCVGVADAQTTDQRRQKQERQKNGSETQSLFNGKKEGK